VKKGIFGARAWQEVLQQLGYSDAEIAEFRTRKIV
jgi:hypothetical protein